METIEYRNIDKAHFPDGPWNDEYDKKQWKDADTGLPCLVKRHSKYGHLCGYVGVLSGHPYFEKQWDEIDVDVHGGPTYSDFCQDAKNEADGICHVAETDEAHVWWIGFDCAHLGDCSPGIGIMFGHESYKTTAYVESECKRLAAQLAGIGALSK